MAMWWTAFRPNIILKFGIIYVSFDRFFSIDWKLNAEEQTKLKLKWCRKILRGGQELEDEIRRRLFKKE